MGESGLRSQIFPIVQYCSTATLGTVRSKGGIVFTGFYMASFSTTVQCRGEPFSSMCCCVLCESKYMHPT